MKKIFDVLSPRIFAHEEELIRVDELAQTFSLEEFLNQTSIIGIIVAGAVALLFVLLAIFLRPENNTLKKILFVGIAVPIVLATLYLAGSTVYLNLSSATGGPVHWHADFEIWACGQKIDIVDPTGLSNRVGTPTFHEHGDNRIHVEGVVKNLEEASLGNFFRFIGGEINQNHLEVPTNEKRLHFDNGDQCGENQAGVVQAFVYQTKDDKFAQEKLADPDSYIISPYGNVPPGDCVIVEFDIPKVRTDKLCNFYKLAVDQGKIHEH